MSAESIRAKLQAAKEAKNGGATIAATSTVDTPPPVVETLTAKPPQELSPLAQKLAARRANPAAIKTIAVPSNASSDTSAIPDAKLQSLLMIPADAKELEGFAAEEFVGMLPQLQAALDAKAPGIAGYLGKINENLNQYQELAHLLNEEQLGVICSGFFFLTDTNMAAAVGKPRSKKTMTAAMAEALF